MKITKLEPTIIGKGEVKGIEFKQVFENANGYVYQRSDNACFEAMRKQLVPICIDFEKRIYSETEFKEVFPKSKDFGVWAWSCATLESAIKKLTS